MAEIRGIEIFRAGAYPQGSYDEAFLDRLVANYDPKFHEAPNYLDHEDENGKRMFPLAFGWVSRIWREGKTLLADLRDVPKQFMDWWREGRVKKRSVELYPDLAGRGPYLRALAWPPIPQIKGLLDFPKAVFTDNGSYLTLCFEENGLDAERRQIVAHAREKMIKTFGEHPDLTRFCCPASFLWGELLDSGRFTAGEAFAQLTPSELAEIHG
jgi:hypothetical protein